MVALLSSEGILQLEQRLVIAFELKHPLAHGAGELPRLLRGELPRHGELAAENYFHAPRAQAASFRKQLVETFESSHVEHLTIDEIILKIAHPGGGEHFSFVFRAFLLFGFSLLGARHNMLHQRTLHGREEIHSEPVVGIAGPDERRVDHLR